MQFNHLVIGVRSQLETRAGFWFFFFGFFVGIVAGGGGAGGGGAGGGAGAAVIAAGADTVTREVRSHVWNQ